MGNQRAARWTSCARRWIVVVALSLADSHSLGAQRSTAAAFDRPRVRGSSSLVATRAANARIAAQIGGGALAAGLLGFAAWTLLDNPEGSDRRVKGDAGYTPNANTAFAVGSFVGSTVAVYLIGRGDRSRGSFAATALGAAIATIPIALGRHEPYLPIIGIVLGAPAQAIGATVGYQLTRREP
jgi:hypothetical protein